MEKWEYRVAVKDIQSTDERGHLVRNRKGTIDEETGEVIGLVSNRYRVIQNKTLYDVMQNVAGDLNLKLNNVYVCRNKAITIFRYGFGENKQVAIESSQTKDDLIRFGVEVYNSFDSTGVVPSSGMRFIAERLVCTNGMTLPRTISRISFKDIPSFDGNEFKRSLTDRIVPVLATARVWNEWAQFTPNKDKVSGFIQGRFSKKVGNSIVKGYWEGKDKTLWGLYNLVTYYITHELKTRNIDNTRLRQLELGRIETDFYETDFK